jgi:predicted GIY-YIG superfamily endonuclease
VRVAYVEEFADRKTALIREQQLKRRSRLKKEAR